MQTIIEYLGSITGEAFERAGYPMEVAVSVSDRPDLCQYQCNNAFQGAKAYHKSPLMIAEDVVKLLSEKAVFADVQAVKPGFINMVLTDEFLLGYAQKMAEDEHLGIPQAEKKEKIVIDYGGPNVAKPLHIGHLRSAVIGQALKLISREMGHEAVGDIHLGDWGLQIGLVIAELSERHPEWKVFSPDFKEGDEVPVLTTELLSEVYPTASGRSKTDEAFREKAHFATRDLQERRPGYIALWQEIMRVSVGDLKQNYEKLSVDFEYWYGESDADKDIPALMEILEKKGLSYESDGALVVDVAEESDKAPVPPVIVRKSDGSSIYATTDLATIIQRERDLAPDRIWYVVDNRQELHLTQVFRCARKAGLVPESTGLEFLGFGTMNGTDGKPYKTRDGGVMRLSDMIGTVTDAALERIVSQGNITENPEDYARRIGIAAIKFGDLINHRSKDYIFDLDKFMSSEGKTGVYILYTVSRINSVLAKAESRGSFAGITTGEERDLVLALVNTPEMWRLSLNERAPSYICENVYRISSVFSHFYHENRIGDEADEKARNTRLALSELTRRMIVKHLNALGIEPVDRM
ncbi:MAG: arginine--tRNA ligase [Oscillospiraceae bacterium]|nr:arginine--tRNA ligase [Oscillospiraceae bacterium]